MPACSHQSWPPSTQPAHTPIGMRVHPLQATTLGVHTCAHADHPSTPGGRPVFKLCTCPSGHPNCICCLPRHQASILPGIKPVSSQASSQCPRRRCGLQPPLSPLASTPSASIVEVCLYPALTLGIHARRAKPRLMGEKLVGSLGGGAWRGEVCEVCVCGGGGRVRACVRACVCPCVCMCVCPCACACVCGSVQHEHTTTGGRCSVATATAASHI